jgi:predicted MFS family arabinose efflux permease
MALRLLERDRGAGFAGGADVPGAVLVTSALMLAVYTIVKPAAEQGWGDSTTLLLGAASLALLVGFVVREATAANPLMPLRMFRNRNVAGANAIQALTVAGMFGMFFLGSLYLRDILGYDALQTGLAFLPTTIMIGVLSIRYAERLIMRFGARGTLIPGLTLLAAGLALFTRTPVDGSYLTDVFPVTIVLGLGAGMSFPALMTVAMSGATQRDAGLASGLVNTTLQVGAALGLAVLATLAESHSKGLIAEGHGVAASQVAGFHVAFWVGTGLVAAAVAIAVAVLRPAAPQGGEPAAEEAGPGAAEPALTSEAA